MISKTWFLLFVAGWCQTCSLARLSSNTASSEDLECGMRALALEYARKIQAWREPEDLLFQQIHDALQLTSLCGQTRPSTTKQRKLAPTEAAEALRSTCQQAEANCIYVAVNGSDTGDGSEANPVGCLHEALRMSRAGRNETESNNKITKIILRGGIHQLGYLSLKLSGSIDSDLQFLAYPNEDAWISGGIGLGDALKWDRWSHDKNIWVADLTDLLGDDAEKVPKVPSLFTSGPDHRRYIRARYPNDDPEIHSEDRKSVCLASDLALEWHKPKKGPSPTFDVIRVPKNDSTMDGYNLYASGHGGVCEEIWGPDADSYWCSSYSQGGWAEVDREAAMTGQMQLPVGVTWNHSNQVGQHLGRLTEDEAVNGIVFAWHSQTWAMHMFAISAKPAINQFEFEKGGGKQGGRNWCRCDQCTYAGHWCGQHNSPPDNSDTRLISGLWWLENVLPELDQPGEFWYNHSSRKLYVYPNTTDGDTKWASNLRFAILDNLFDLRNVSNVEISGIGFRDAAATFMSDWSAPSGGDWSLHRGGALYMENATDIVIRDSTFRRLDCNGIFLSKRNRNILIRRNTFEWLAENAIATWGSCQKMDCTGGDQPFNTMIYENVMRELGIYEKQSSALGQNKAALSDVRNNIMFNLPRAAINFNDMTGGGDRVVNNLIFNSCRESGDHGPINSWDRQAYMSILSDGKTPSFEPLPRLISGNYIIANYGADQGVDNDDGSSWFHVRRNVFYDASGFKMDYGGHDSVFEENLVLASGRKACTGFGSFLPGHGDIVRFNQCIVGLETISSRKHGNLAGPRDSAGNLREREPDNIAYLSTCKDSNAILFNNSYYTPHGNASINCYDIDGGEVSLTELQERYGLERGSFSTTIPPVDTILGWARSLLITEENVEAYRY